MQISGASPGPAREHSGYSGRAAGAGCKRPGAAADLLGAEGAGTGEDGGTARETNGESLLQYYT